MGLTPTGGIISGSRTGDIDPGVLIFILNKIAETTPNTAEAADKLETVVSKKSGLLGVSELSNDMRDLRDAIKDGNAKARLAVDKFSWTIAALDRQLCGRAGRAGHAGVHRRHRRKRHRLARRDLRRAGRAGHRARCRAQQRARRGGDLRGELAGDGARDSAARRPDDRESRGAAAGNESNQLAAC